jgi:hypothetical protein
MEGSVEDCPPLEKGNSPMIEARLLVERGTLRDQSEDWGAYNFLGLPSPADRVAVHRGNETHYLTVICVHHAPVAARDGGMGPTAQVVAKWTGAE